MALVVCSPNSDTHSARPGECGGHSLVVRRSGGQEELVHLEPFLNSLAGRGGGANRCLEREKAKLQS